MKNKIPGLVLIPMILILVSSCSVIEVLYKDGTGIVVFLVVISVTIVAFILSKIIEKYKIRSVRNGNLNF